MDVSPSACGLSTGDLFDLSDFTHAALFEHKEWPWLALTKIGQYLAANGKSAILGKVSPQAIIEGVVYIGEGTVVEPHAYIKGPAWIGDHCEVRVGAYIRGNVVTGNKCVLGNSCEFKNSILLNHVQVPHFAYVGDSILGNRAHLASGVTLSNLKVTSGHVKVEIQGQRIDTGLRKFGAILGDESEVGCHGVLNPGSIIGKRSILYPGVSWRGICPANTMVKLKQEHQLVSRRTT
jgi:UDP-N-acetylglucosamine diphosphorylase / glucose-1-phosphate thymidylyltransferase / UDP-N-acetylgalactosamine diphosphorylase / glucosamine-1-phosphate N-acetyltransferase / galactosamine-1-phosphate N-acetyltransferase